MATRSKEKTRVTQTIQHVFFRELERALEQLTQEVADLKRQLNATFQHLHQILAHREETLVAELDAIPAGISAKLSVRRESLEQLTQHKEETEMKLQVDAPNKLLQQQLSVIQTEMDRILSEDIFFPRLSLNCNTEVIQKTLEENCHILKPLTPYPARTVPLWNRGCELYDPTAVCIDPTTQLVFVGDGKFYRIQVFTTEGKRHTTLYNEKLTHIDSMKIHGRHIYVSIDKSIFKMDKNGIIIKSCDTNTITYGLFIHGVKLYACTENSLTIQVYDLNIKPSKKVKLRPISFNKNTTPRDVIVNKQQLFVLFSFLNTSMYYHPDPVQIFQLDGTFIRSLIFGNQIEYGNYFCLDSYENILVSDHEGSCIRIFSPDGILIQSIGREGNAEEGELDCPHGIAVDSRGRIIIADRKNNNKLQAF